MIKYHHSNFKNYKIFNESFRLYDNNLTNSNGLFFFFSSKLNMAVIYNTILLLLK